MTERTDVKITNGLGLGFGIALGAASVGFLYSVAEAVERLLPQEVREVAPYDETDDAETGRRSGMAICVAVPKRAKSRFEEVASAKQ